MKKNSPKRTSIQQPAKKSWFFILAFVNVLAFLAVLVVNYLAVALPLGGMTTGALADLYPNLFVPAGITFSIWGLIYLLVLGFVAYQLVDIFRKQSRGITKKVGIWFFLSCLTNIGWIFAWHYQQVALSVGIMILFLGILIVLSYMVGIGKKIGTWKEKLLVQIPFSIYLGRISVATIANITALLVHIGWSGWGMSDLFWTILLVVVAAFLALFSLYKKADIFYALVIIWAFLGIILKRIAIDPISATSLIWVLGVCIAVIALGIGLQFDHWKKN